MEFHTCCFTGHRHIPPYAIEELTAILDRRIAALCDIGFTEFRTGGALGFDTLAAVRVLVARKTHPQIRLHLILPCRDQAAKWQRRDVQLYERILERADQVTYVQEHYSAGCMHARNRALVDGSQLCLAFLTSTEGGTAYTASFAAKKGVRLINLAREMETMQ